MTSEAPERIIVAKCHPFKEPDDFYVCHPRLQHPAGVEYVRADLHQQALAEAEARGYARAIEEALAIVNDSFPDYEGGCSLQDQAARDLRNTIFYDIRALAQKEGE